jgi:hypothetical protein
VVSFKKSVSRFLKGFFMLVGDILHIVHSRKGSFDMRATSVNGDTVSGIILSGFAEIGLGSFYGKGDDITIDLSRPFIKAKVVSTGNAVKPTH